MSSGERIPYDRAWLLACGLGNALLPACYRVEIAGSVRRNSETVGDLDFVCEPIVKPELDMFGEPSGAERNLLHEKLDDLVAKGILCKRLNKLGHASWGPELRRAVHEGLGVDVQIVRDRTTWGAWLAIRTGPAALNKAIVTPRSKGGLLPPGFEFRDGFQLYRYGGRIETPTEQSVFEALGLPYLEPSERAFPLPAHRPTAAGGTGGAR